MTQKILVVDDEPDIELLVKSKFRKRIKDKELEFVFASNGVEALAKLEADTDLNIILTDINMPEMDGLTLLTMLPKLNRILKAIVISAYGDMSNIRRAMNLGAADFIIKPIDFQDLEVTISKTIHQYEELKEALETKMRLTSIENELEIARRLQQAMLPKSFTPMAGINSFELFGMMIPAREVGGDFFDFFPLSKEKLGLVIADVSGKSIGAALFMAISKSLIRAFAPGSGSPEAVMRSANSLIARENESSMFITAFYAVLDVRSGEIAYCNAGHNPPYIISKEGGCRQIGALEGMALGICEAEEVDKTKPYKLCTDRLKDGEILLLYTDGITEAMNSEGRIYGEQRLEHALRAGVGLPLPQMAAELLADVKKYRGDEEQSDDETLLYLKFLGPQDTSYKESQQASFSAAAAHAPEDELAILKEKILNQQKLVSLGMLCAGAAHEIKNPLNFIANFAALSMELFDELTEKLHLLISRNPELLAEVEELLTQMRQNGIKILEHSRRVESVVMNMLAQAQGSATHIRSVNLHQLINEIVNLSFHGMRALDPSFNVKFEKKYDPDIKEIKIVPDEITRVLHNLLHNAYYATHQKKRQKGESYQPLIVLQTKQFPDSIEIIIWDNGEGIKKENLDRIFTPFFTTKSAQDGSGLGLAISKAIVTEIHKGQICARSLEGEWAEFSISLPKLP